MASENRASTAAGPALKVDVSSLLVPSASAKKPFSTPVMALAWVMFGKYPNRTVTAAASAFAELFLSEDPHAVRAMIATATGAMSERERCTRVLHPSNPDEVDHISGNSGGR